jgi:putative ABC transport system permease protein
MLKNYFLIAWRNLWQHRILSAIKILGLSLGLMVCVLIFLFTKDELSYDRFHENSNNIYRIIQHFEIGKERNQTIGTTNAILGQTFQKEIPGIGACTHVNGNQVTIKTERGVFNEFPLFVDDNFYSVFSYSLLAGNREKVLRDPYSIVISEEMAGKYFPDEISKGTDALIGKTLQIKINEEFENFRIAGIAANPPQNSSLRPSLLIPFVQYEKYNDNKEWFGGSVNTFLLISPGLDMRSLVGKMQALYNQNTKDQLDKIRREEKMDIRVSLGLQPLTDIHLSTKAGPDNGMEDGSKPAYAYILNFIAVFILLIACINFINLSVAQSLKRSKEIGIRKVVGGTRRQLIKQFFAESFLYSLIAFVFGLFLSYIALPLFNEMANKKLSLSYLSDGYFYAGLVLLLLVTAFIAGLYPSIVLSSFQPVKVLYEKIKFSGRHYFTRGLIVLQFSLSILLIIGALTIRRQMNFLSNADLGYEPKELIRIDLPVRKSSDALPTLFKEEFRSRPDILKVAARNAGYNESSVKIGDRNIPVQKTRVDEAFFPTFEVSLLAGRNFSAAIPSDIMNGVLINESLAREAGWDLNSSLGKTMSYLNNGRLVTVIGVVKDFHYSSLKEKIWPSVYTMDSNFNYGQLWIKIRAGDVTKTMAGIQATFRKILPYYPFSYQFMEEINASHYKSEEKWKQIIETSSALFIFISCMGLLGLVMLTVTNRTKEIGIRKVLGAALMRIVLLISGEFFFLILISFLVAVPLGYYGANKWLQDFAYRTSLSWWIFAWAGLLTLLVAMITISFQAIRAAIANPVKSLRSE